MGSCFSTMLGDKLLQRKFHSLNNPFGTIFNPVSFSWLMEENGAGEIIVQSVDHDGTMKGYDLELVRKISENVSIPVVALGGAGIL